MKKYWIICAALALCACAQKTSPMKEANIDPLALWNEGPVKASIISFVADVTAPESTRYVPEADRIAVFDNDGTLWCEMPLYNEMVYSVAAAAHILKSDPALAKTPELQALAKGDPKPLIAAGEKGIGEAFVLSHVAVSPEKFALMTREWLDTAYHARFKIKYEETVYSPMVELLYYLRDNGFKTFIVSGGSSMFMREFADKVYGIPTEQVIGTMFKGEFVADSTGYRVVYKPELWHLDDGGGKPVGIEQIIGKKPILAFGNSDGDVPMLQWTSTNTRPHLCLLLHHTDAEREYAYDRTSPIGKLDKGLDEAAAKGWTLVDMKKDFAKVFGF